MANAVISDILLDVGKAVVGFNSLPCEHRRATLTTIVNKLCAEELSHVVEIAAFLRKYFESTLADRSEVLVMGVEELLKYLNELRQCPAKSGCVLLIAVAALFVCVSYEVLNQVFDDAYTDRSVVRNVCAFIEHLPCIDQQIKACLVLHRKMLMDSARLRTGAIPLAFRVKKIKRYTDFPRAKHAEELRRLKLALPEGVYAIIWNYASISAGQFMVPGGQFEQIGSTKAKAVDWRSTANKQAKYEFITTDGGSTFTIRNSDSALYLAEIEDGFCFVEKSDDNAWSVEVVRREDDYFYKITNVRTGSSLYPPTEVRLQIENSGDGYNLVDFTERSLVVVQKFELNRPSGRCSVQ
ncbi:hypothetical protein RP20_CCG019747 [Aedes albopictus]|nr:hypothetical protein RP20_CCG019747 [Aedes albopictus]